MTSSPKGNGKVNGVVRKIAENDGGKDSEKRNGVESETKGTDTDSSKVLPESSEEKTSISMADRDKHSEEKAAAEAQAQADRDLALSLFLQEQEVLISVWPA